MPIREDTTREIETRTHALIREAEQRGEIEMPQTLTSAAELRTFLGGHIPGCDTIPGYAIMKVIDHEVEATIDMATRQLGVHLRPVAVWQYDGRELRVPRGDVDLGLALYRSRGGR